MCGIAAVFSQTKQINEQRLRRMCDAMRHRGPDDEGYYTNPDKTLALGMRRLSVIDLNTGHQPIHNEDRTLWLVLNGEIYNYVELRGELEKKHTFYTKTDTEVIIHLYEEYGENCVQHLRGMFAFVLWDSSKKRVFAAKDRIGKKPLYYTVKDDVCIFASELNAVAQYLGYLPDTDPESIDLYLTYQYIPSPKTIYKGIYSLMPAHTLTCDAPNKIVTKEYWTLDFTQKTALSFDQACTRTRELLTDSVRARMIADVPLGAFLSGGIDSSIVVALMSTLSSRPVKTYSVGFEEADFSELKYARMVAQQYQTDHHEFILNPNFIDILPKLVWHYGQPYADPSALPSYYVSHQTRQHVTVALNGDGGDETFGGYQRYRAMKGSLYAGLPFKLMGAGMSKAIASLIPHTETAKNKSMYRYLYRLISALHETPAMRNISWHIYFTQEERHRLYTDDLRERITHNAYEYMQELFESAPAKTIMDKTFYTDLRSYLPECLMVKMDIASMANSLEARSPFLDHTVLEFSASLPDQWKINTLFTTKHILKKAFASMLPPPILAREKMGFGVPVGKWFRADWESYYRDVVIGEKALSRGYFKRKVLEDMYFEHVTGTKDHGNKMWALLMLELWHQHVQDKGVA